MSDTFELMCSNCHKKNTSLMSGLCIQCKINSEKTECSNCHKNTILVMSGLCSLCYINNEKKECSDCHKMATLTISGLCIECHINNEKLQQEKCSNCHEKEILIMSGLCSLCYTNSEKYYNHHKGKILLYPGCPLHVINYNMKETNNHLYKNDIFDIRNGPIIMENINI